MNHIVFGFFYVNVKKSANNLGRYFIIKYNKRVIVGNCQFKMYSKTPSLYMLIESIKHEGIYCLFLRKIVPPLVSWYKYTCVFTY